jgi:hypothetical protein
VAETCGRNKRGIRKEKGGATMKLWNVKVGFVGGEKKILYVKVYSVKAETKEIAALIVYNGLSLMEFKNFEILRVSEIEH